MLTALDSELFPDDCEVVEIPSRDLRIYLIQKNGTSSLRVDAIKQNWKIIKNQDLKTLSSVDVYLRDPRPRCISGINTFVQYLLRNNPELDKRTYVQMALRYPFLNRHYLPQWHWVANLARFIDKDCIIRFHHIEELKNITHLRLGPQIDPIYTDWAESIDKDLDKLELWFLLDRILLGYCGQGLTWAEIMSIYQTHPKTPLNIITERLQQITNVLRQT